MGFGHRQRHVDDGVERVSSVGGGQCRHPLHDGGAGAPATMPGVDRHRHLCAVEVVTQRHFHHAHPDERTSGLVHGGEQVEPAIVPGVPGERPDVLQAETRPVRPRVPLDGVQDAVPSLQVPVVGGVDRPDLHPLRMPWHHRDRCRPRTVSGGRRRTPARPRRCNGRAGRRPPRRSACALVSRSAGGRRGCASPRRSRLPGRRRRGSRTRAGRRRRRAAPSATTSAG